MHKCLLSFIYLLFIDSNDRNTRKRYSGIYDLRQSMIDTSSEFFYRSTARVIALIEQRLGKKKIN